MTVLENSVFALAMGCSSSNKESHPQSESSHEKGVN